MTTFESLGLSAPLLRALAAEGYSVPTPIQAKAIPHVLAGRDLFGCAQTGTGKTAAFALPLIERMLADRRTPAPRRCRTLVLAPTRELASQIHDSFRAYGRHAGLKAAVIFGGVSQRPQSSPPTPPTNSTGRPDRATATATLARAPPGWGTSPSGMDLGPAPLPPIRSTIASPRQMVGRKSSVIPFRRSVLPGSRLE